MNKGLKIFLIIIAIVILLFISLIYGASYAAAKIIGNNIKNDFSKKNKTIPFEDIGFLVFPPKLTLKNVYLQFEDKYTIKISKVSLGSSYSDIINIINNKSSFTQINKINANFEDLYIFNKDETINLKFDDANIVFNGNLNKDTFKNLDNFFKNDQHFRINLKNMKLLNIDKLLNKTEMDQNLIDIINMAGNINNFDLNLFYNKNKKELNFKQLDIKSNSINGTGSGILQLDNNLKKINTCNVNLSYDLNPGKKIMANIPNFGNIAFSKLNIKTDLKISAKNKKISCLDGYADLNINDFESVIPHEINNLLRKININKLDSINGKSIKMKLNADKKNNKLSFNMNMDSDSCFDCLYDLNILFNKDYAKINSLNSRIDINNIAYKYKSFIESISDSLEKTFNLKIKNRSNIKIEINKDKDGNLHLSELD